ncbi:MAG: hypothetical protein ACYTFA_06115, partial [Planctomycetota bacterium]
MKVLYCRALALVVATAGLAGIAMGEVLPPLEAPPPHNERKNRYISFTPADTDNPVAYSVDLVTCDLFPDSTGFVGWVGTP